MRMIASLELAVARLSFFKLQVRWLHSLAPVTYQNKRLGIHELAAFLQLELFRAVADNVPASIAIYQESATCVLKKI